MRIAMLCPYSLSRPGGVQGQVTGLARALTAAGHATVVLAPTDGPVDVPGLEATAIVRLGGSVALPANGSVAPVCLSPAAAVRAVRAVRRGGFDVVHLHEPLAPGPGYGCLVACRLPMVGTFHRAGAGIAYRLLGPVARPAARRLAVRCAVSDEAAATARQALGGTYRVVGNGIELDRFSRAVPSVTEGPTVLFVGRHEERKGLDVLLEAHRRLQPAAAPILWVAGQGPATERLRRRHPSTDRLVWLGRVDDGELAARMAGAHALCAPSLGGESFGVVLLEAMAARTAVIASDLPGYASVVGDHGLLVAPGDVEALGRALATLTADATNATGWCAPGALEAAVIHASRWAMPAVADRYVHIYDQILGAARRD